MKHAGITIQTAAELLGVSVNTLRNWDAKGILPARREKNGYRYYDISRLNTFAKKTGKKIHTLKNP